MSQRSLVPLLVLAALVPVALSLQAKTAARPQVEAPPRDETHTATPMPEKPVITRRAPAPGTLGRSLADHPPPSEPSAPPTKAEWNDTDALNVDGADRCTAHRVREWLQLRCRIMQGQQLALLAGARDGLTLGITRPSAADWWDTREEVTMPLRRGDRRVIGVTVAETGRYSSGGPETTLVVSEVWLEGDAPVLHAQ